MDTLRTDPATRGPARLRVWMSGSLAVVMAAVLGLRELPEDERARRVLRSSPYGVAETMQRLEAEAAARGIAVLARADGAEPVIVLQSAAGGTPVAQAEDEPGALGAPGVPLALHVRAAAGGSEVLLGTTPERLDAVRRVVSRQAADELAALPRLVDGALG